MSPNLAFNKSQLNSNKFQLLQPLQPSSQNSWEFLAGVPRWEPGGDRCPPALGTLEQRPWERKGAEGISCCPLLGLPWGKERRPGKPSQNSPSRGKTPLLFPPTLPRAQPQHPMEMEVPPWGLRCWHCQWRSSSLCQVSSCSRFCLKVFQDLFVLNHPPNKVQAALLRAAGDGINKNQG